MEKKKYEKPIVLDLNGNTASGGPLSCVPGGSATGGETCVGGFYAGWSCSGGTEGSSDRTPCKNGTGVSSGDCVFGTSPGATFCEGGLSGTNVYGCHVGPSVNPT